MLHRPTVLDLIPASLKERTQRSLGVFGRPQRGTPLAWELHSLELLSLTWKCHRLDVDTTGLMLLGTDGGIGQMLLHPRSHVSKTYEVQLLVPSHNVPINTALL